jgi:hypothetical protein
MAKKKNAIQKAGSFAANELLGVDDMRRVVKYVRQGDYKRAAKSAGAAAAEIGSTVAPIGAGFKIGKIAGKAATRTQARSAGMAAARDVAEKTPRGKLGSAGGKQFSKKTEPKKRITVTDASGKEKAGTYGGSKVEGTTAKRSMNARLGDAKRGDTNRTKKVIEAGIRTEKAVTKSSTKPKTYARAGAAAGATPIIAKPKKKNKGN